MNTVVKQKYSLAAMVLHWLIAFLVIVNWRLAESAEHTPRAVHEAIMGKHFSVGVVLLLLGLARVAVRVASPAPPLGSHLKAWEALLARITHALLGLLVIVLPLLGWLAISCFGKGVAVFGLFELPALPMPANKDLGETLFEAHGVLGSALVYLMFLHVAAVIKHMVIDRDGNLFRMLPFGKVRD